jgi:PPP family 3-phenylpropionic acid transporter
MQASHGVYYTFYTIYLEGHGYSRGIIGQLWAFGVIAEVLAFLVMHRLLKRFSLHNLLITSLGLASLRWLLIGYYPGLLTVLLFAQTLHAASFGLFHAVAIQFIFQYFPGQLQGRGQALYSSFSFGAGSAIGSLSSGYLWDTIGAQESYLLAALTCGIAAWISWQWVKPNRV